MELDTVGWPSDDDVTSQAVQVGQEVGGLVLGAAAIGAAVVTADAGGCQTDGLTTIVHVAEAYDFGRELGGAVVTGLESLSHDIGGIFDPSDY